MRVKAFAAFCLTLLCAAVCALPDAPARAQGAPRRGAQPPPQSAARQSERPKQVVIGRGSDDQRGSRMTITSDEALNDYSAYRSGDRFYVELPNANAATGARAAGRGFSDLQVQRRGKNVVLSYRIQPGARPRVEQRFNRLEVIFEVPAGEAAPAATTTSQPPARPASANLSPSPAARTETATRPARTPAPQADGTQPPPTSPAPEEAAQQPPAQAPAAAQPAPQEWAQSQPPAPATTDAAAQTGSGASVAAFLVRNWAVLLVAVVLVAGLGLLAATRRTAPAAPAAPACETSAGETVRPAGAGLLMSETAAVEALTPEPPAPEPSDAVPVEHAPRAAEPPVSESSLAAAHAGEEKGVAPFDEDSSVPADLRQRLASREPSERAAAVAALARVEGGEAFQQICAAFDDEERDVRAAAARALYDVQGDRADSFTRALREATASRRRSIGAAIASSGLAADAISQLTGESREKTYEAFSLLFLMAKAGEVTPLVRAVEGHASHEVRLAVVKLLALSGQKEVLPAFRRLAVRGSLPTEVRSAVMEAIYQISSQSETSPAA